ncbi:dTMP kinase [Sphingosinicella sp. CPCC 101087]|uniref:dTMP kinase n=1 Tax=Sphingosinicella sp. CPCC 101087 TaxID=2497754 RepID=UPI00101CF2E0|nr:dTMP kinase [Sphingosinicella sp. CPCC 101087]
MIPRFVTLEGGEGVGKSTQLKALAEVLRARGPAVVETREPGGSPGAEAIRSLLLQGDIDRWTGEAEALLFAAARSDHVTRTIKPALDRGQWVLCDRFLDSSIAYQGMVGGLGVEAIRRLHAIGSGGFLPDRTLLLRLDGDEAAARTRRRDADGADRFGARDAAYHAGIAAAFDRLAAEEPERFRVIDAAGEAETVTKRLLAALEDLL